MKTNGMKRACNGEGRLKSGNLPQIRGQLTSSHGRERAGSIWESGWRMEELRGKHAGDSYSLSQTHFPVEQSSTDGKREPAVPVKFVRDSKARREEMQSQRV